MPVNDPYLRRVSAHHLLYKNICRDCGALNPFKAKKCRRCHRTDLRQKSRDR
jgi:large subunit ribosomal protein L40e